MRTIKMTTDDLNKLLAEAKKVEKTYDEIYKQVKWYSRQIMNKYAEEDLECALEDMAYWVAHNFDDAPLIFRNDQVQEKFYKLVKEYKHQ